MSLFSTKPFISIVITKALLLSIETSSINLEKINMFGATTNEVQLD